MNKNKRSINKLYGEPYLNNRHEYPKYKTVFWSDRLGYAIGYLLIVGPIAGVIVGVIASLITGDWSNFGWWVLGMMALAFIAGFTGLEEDTR